MTVVARLGYRLKVVPFGSNEVLVSDSCSACAERIDVVSMDNRLLVDTADGLQASVKTDELQTKFIAQLKSLGKVSQGFVIKKYRSPFLGGSNPLVREVGALLGSPEMPQGSVSIVDSEFEIANHPEEIRDALSNFLRNSDAYADSLSKARGITAERSNMMVSLLKERYPITEESYNTKVEFEWRPPESEKRGRLDLLKPLNALVAGLKEEVKPEIEVIEKQHAIEKGRIEQRSILERNRLERTYDTQSHNAKRDMELEVKRLESEKDSYEGQLDIMESQYEDTAEALRNAENEYRELSETDSTVTAQRLTNKIADLENDLDNLSGRKDDAEQTLDNLRSELESTKRRHRKNIQGIQDAKDLALKSHESGLKIQISALEELGRRKIDDKLAHVTEIEKEKSVIEEMATEEPLEEIGASIATERFELPSLWSDRKLLEKKVGAIEGLQQTVVERIDETFREMKKTREFLQGHLVRLPVAAPSVTVDMVFPFWYIEIESGKEGQAAVETFVVPPSEVVPIQSEAQGKTAFGVNFMPTIASAASALESIKEYQKVQACGRSNNQVNDIDPDSILLQESRLVQGRLMSKDLFEVIKNDFRNRFGRKG